MFGTYVFVDAAYVRSSLEHLGFDWTEVDLFGLANLACSAVSHNRGWSTPHRVFVYDAGHEDPASDRNPKVRQWLERNDLQVDTHLRWGRLAAAPAKRPPRQKRVDVQLAVDALTAAYRGLCDTLVLITGDADFAPLIESVRDSGPTTGVAVFDVPSNSEELRRSADRWGTIQISQPVLNGIRLST